MRFEKTKLSTIYHDNPEFTKDYQLRRSLCITIPNDVMFEENSYIDSMIIPFGKKEQPVEKVARWIKKLINGKSLYD